MAKKNWGFFPVLFCGLIFGVYPQGGREGKADPGYSEGEAFFPVVDALSSASILRTDAHTMVYVGERMGTSYWLNRVDLDNPGKKISRNVGSNVAVIKAGGGRIGIIQAVEHGYEAFAGSYIKIYDAASLKLLQTFPLAPPAAEGRTVEPLHHRDPSLALSDKYAVVLTEDDGFFTGGGPQQYVSVYDMAGNKGASHTPAFSGAGGGPRGAANPALGTGVLMGAVINGDYLILGGSAGTAVFKIDAGGADLAITRIADSDGQGNHWFKDNGAYVLESKSGSGTVKLWKWDGAPRALGTVDINGNNSGNVQTLCFDPDDPALAYFYCKAAATAAGSVPASPNSGNVYSVDLKAETPRPVLRFKFPSLVIRIGSAYYNPVLTGLWTIEKQRAGADEYFVFSGSYSYTPGGGGSVTLGAVLTVKNPAEGETIGGVYGGANSALDPKLTEERFNAPYNTAVRTLKTFKNGKGKLYLAAKNYSARGAPSEYRLILEEIR
jgi:WD40 repeat protein